MKALIQRVRQASVTVNAQEVGRIGQGLLVLFCAEHGDNTTVADALLAKILKLRIFSDDNGKMNRSLLDLNGVGTPGGLLLVSQFTLAADCSSGNRPSFTAAAPAALAQQLYDYTIAQARQQLPQVASGIFAADMQVSLTNDGPVTIWLDIPAHRVSG